MSCQVLFGAHRVGRIGGRCSWYRLLPALALGVAASSPVRPAAAAEPTVVAVAACDGYAELKQQLRWLGTQIGNPALDGFAESFVMMATQFKGLAGLDQNRPAGVIVTVNDDLPAVHGFVPVKDLDKLLTALEGVLGRAEAQGAVRRLSPPGGMPLDVTLKEGWAAFSARGTSCPIDDPMPYLRPIVDDTSLGVEVFPSRMPPGMRKQLAAALDQLSEAAAAQGQPVDREALAVAMAGLDDTESLLLGLALDTASGRAFLESRTVLEPHSLAAAMWTAATKADNGTVATPAATGRSLAIRAHHAQAVPQAARGPLEATLDVALPRGDDDPRSRMLAGLIRDLTGAMLDAGGFDVALALDTAGRDDTHLLPALTLGFKVKDGEALERSVKARLGADGVLPPEARVRFDTGRQGAARLHEIEVDLAGVPEAERFGGRVVLTLAVTPDRAYLLTGDDVAARVADLLAAGGQGGTAAAPLTGVDVSLASLLDYLSKIGRAFMPGDPRNAAIERMAEVAGDLPASEVQLLVRPIERGVRVRLSADEGVIQTIAAGAGQAPLVPGGGIPPLQPGPGRPALAP
jgi:hypothetical protein